MGRRPTAAFLVFASALLWLAGCDENAFVGDVPANLSPRVRLTGGPVEGDTTSYQIKFSWIGYDPDGSVECYEYAICDGNPGGFDPADTTGLDKWTEIRCTDSVFAFSASGTNTGWDEWNREVWWLTVHTFFIRAVDNQGARSIAAYRSFTASTIAPFVVIESPRNPFPGAAQQLPSLVKFVWRGVDPIDDPWNVQQPDSIRYLLAPYDMYLLDNMNAHPEDFEEKWCPWISYRASGDSGTSTIVGDDEIVVKGSEYAFVVQAKDDAGATTALFDRFSNARVFRVFSPPGPMLTVTERNLGTYSFLGSNNRIETFRIPGGLGLSFSWTADASGYGSDVRSYRYGWDIADLDDQSEWAVIPSPFVKEAPPVSFRTGVHTLYVEAEDNLGTTTLAQLEVTIFPAKMTRNLLWVDDFYSTDFTQKDYAFPTESEHDRFWLKICDRAVDFNPGYDVYVAADWNFRRPDLETLWRYKNVIWSYSASEDVMVWDQMVRFAPESDATMKFNYFSFYVAAGGHLWTEGRSDSHGGLGAVFLVTNQSFPRNLRCELFNLSAGCPNMSGTTTFPYRTYCVTVIDKVKPAPRIDSRMPQRRVAYDAMAYGFKDAREPLTVGHADLPARLNLWSQVTKPGMFFDPQVQGFTYVELYNPAYWMNIIDEKRQECFIPMYRMRARNTASPVNGDVFAFWSTKYADVVADAEGAVDAPSVHFGLPLWFFNRAQVDSIADTVFREWGINKY